MKQMMGRKLGPNPLGIIGCICILFMPGTFLVIHGNLLRGLMRSHVVRRIPVQL